MCVTYPDVRYLSGCVRTGMCSTWRPWFPRVVGVGRAAGVLQAVPGRSCADGRGPMTFWIGCDDPDRLITYPDACYLSGCVRRGMCSTWRPWFPRVVGVGRAAGVLQAVPGRSCADGRGPMTFWIGCDDPDRLITYPDVRYLSGCAGLPGRGDPISDAPVAPQSRLSWRGV